MRLATSLRWQALPLPQLVCVLCLTFATWFVAELSDGFFEDRFFVVSAVFALALGGYALVLCRSLQQEKHLRRQAEELLRAAGGQPAMAVFRQGNLRWRRAQNGRAAEKLTAREREVLALVANGWSNQGIAERLQISLNTVERHIGNIYRKLDVRGRVEATAYAFQNGLLDTLDC